MVLPTVARKKGLDGQYQTTDGSPKPRKPEPQRPAPVCFHLSLPGAIQLITFPQAPGTFGYDYSKYRPPRDGEYTLNGIELDDFGKRKSIVDTDSNSTEEKLKEGPPSTTATMIEDDRPISTTKQNGNNHRPLPPPSPPSPAPFSHYTAQSPPEPKPVPSQASYPVEGEDHSGGCCKCVIM